MVLIAVYIFALTISIGHSEICSGNVLCSCDNDIIVCSNSGLTEIPKFTKRESTNVVLINLSRNSIRVIKRQMDKSQWKMLKVLAVINCLILNFFKYEIIFLIFIFQTINLLGNPLTCGQGYRNLSCTFESVLTDQCERKYSHFIVNIKC